MPPDLTVITPIAPRHASLFAECAASVAQQTVEVTHLYMIDQGGHGPGAVRNWLVQQVTTPYVTFLDADDWLEPTFAEETLAALHLRPNRYIYTDWLKDDESMVKAPDCAWTMGTHHLVTAVVPTVWVNAVGGFDQTLRGMEDTDFYVKLVTRGFCGSRLSRPLVHYRRGGGRAERIHQSGEIDALNAEMARRYGGMTVSCCGNNEPVPDVPVGERGPNDVAARALWGGNRVQMGLATGRHYPRTGNGKQVWVDPRDIAASPQLWQEVPQVEGASPQQDDPHPKVVAPKPPSESRGLAALEAQLLHQGLVRLPAPPPDTKRLGAPPHHIAALPNITKVVRLAHAAYGEVVMPIFVRPRKFYPSYIDLWKLAELSGHEVLYQDEINLGDERQTFIFAAPESIPNCSGARARTIYWALEYTGDYLSVENADTVSEVWSSDPYHAKRTGARYVLLGSHRGLNPDLSTADQPEHDVTMLAYMVDRRSAIKERLSNYRWPKNYPGHDGMERHRLLSGTRLMLHVHQHAEPAMAPLRYAIAAAYHMPLISEMVPDTGEYGRVIMWSDYDSIPGRVRLYLEGKADDDAQYADKLYQLLCVERPFGRNVMEALKQHNQFDSALGSAEEKLAA